MVHNICECTHLCVLLILTNLRNHISERRWIPHKYSLKLWKCLHLHFSTFIQGWLAQVSFTKIEYFMGVNPMHNSYRNKRNSNEWVYVFWLLNNHSTDFDKNCFLKVSLFSPMRQRNSERRRDAVYVRIGCWRWALQGKHTFGEISVKFREYSLNHVL